MTLTFTKPPQPQINYAHPANKNIQFSYIASPGFSAFDLVKHQFGTKGSAPTQTNDKIIGQAIKFRASQADVYSFAGRGTKALPVTIAFIGILNSNTTGQTIFHNSGGASGLILNNQNGNNTLLFVARNVAVLNPSLAFTNGVPYLFIASMAQNSTVNMLSFRMDTGAIATATSTNGSAPTAGNGTFLLGNFDLLSGSAGADLAAVLYANNFLTLDAMRAWAKDPWGPWRLEQPNPSMLMASSANNNISGTSAMAVFTQTGTALNPLVGAEHWDTTYNTGRWTLTNSNLTATTSTNNNEDSIIGVVGHSSGKYYFEQTASAQPTDFENGIAKSTQSAGAAISLTGAALAYGTNGTFVSTGSTSRVSGLTVTAGMVLGFAVDLNNGRMYVRDTAAPSSWYGNGAGADPVAGTGYFDWSVNNTAAMFMAASSNQNGVARATTMNAGALAFAAAIPSGYTEWADVVLDAALYSSPMHRRLSAGKTYKIR